jgi:hypothetical protein
VMTTGMSAPPIEAVMCAPRPPPSAVVATSAVYMALLLTERV